MAKRRKGKKVDKIDFEPHHEETPTEGEEVEEEPSGETDEEDLKETVEIDMEKMEMTEENLKTQKRVASLEENLEELSEKVADLREEQDEILRRISMSVGDSQLAMKSSEQAMKEIKQQKKKNKKMAEEIEEKLGAFSQRLEESTQFVDQIKNLSETLNNLEERLSTLEDLPDKLVEQKENLYEAIEKNSGELEQFREQVDEVMGKVDTALEKEANLENKVESLSYLEDRIQALEESLREDFLKKLEKVKEDLGDMEGIEQMKQTFDEFQETFHQKIESTEDRYEEIKGFLSTNLDSMEENFRGFREEFQQQLDAINERVGENVSERLASFEARISEIRQEIEPSLEALKEFSTEKMAEMEKKFDQYIEYFAEMELKMEKLKEGVHSEVDEKIQAVDEKIDQSVEEHLQKAKSQMDTFRENQQLEMEVFSEEIGKRISDIEEFRKQAEEALETIRQLESSSEENREKISDLSGKVESIVEEKLQTVESRLEEVRTRLEEQLTEKLEPLEAELHDISGDLDTKLDPIRQEVSSAKSYIEEELMKVKESWEKLDKTISDSEGAMEIAQKARESLERLEKEVNDSISRIDSLMTSIRENSIKTDANLEKINLTIKLIDEARERVKSIQTPPVTAAAAVAMPEAVAAGVPVLPEEMILTPTEILEPPDTSEMGFELDDLLQVMIKHEASDLHIKAGAPPTVRLEGELIPVGSQILTDKDCKNLILSAMSPALRKKLAQKQEVDFAYAIPEARFRVNAFLQKQSISAAFRLLWTDIPTIEELHLPPVLKKLCDYNNGLILVTGPAGCGKSTTLASMINYLNENKKLHIITIEDPIEFIHSDKMSIITQREIGTDTESFPVALKQALRQDPNVILIGEMRDPETIMTAVIAAETGHLVLSTLHTPNTIQAINRIIDVFSGDTQKQFRLLLANTLRGVVSQRLLNRADETGRIPAVEVMVVTHTISSLILEEKTNEIYQMMTQGDIEGMQTFTQHLTKLYEEGLITREEAMFHADQPTEFRLAIEGHTTGTSTMGEDNLMSWL